MRIGGGACALACRVLGGLIATGLIPDSRSGSSLPRLFVRFGLAMLRPRRVAVEFDPTTAAAEWQALEEPTEKGERPFAARTADVG